MAHFPASISAQRRQRLLAASNGPCRSVIQARYGHVSDKPVAPEFGPVPQRLCLDDALIIGMTNIPNDIEIGLVKKKFPSAATVLDRWLFNWNLVLDQNPKARSLLETPRRGIGNYQTEIAWHNSRDDETARLVNGEHFGQWGLHKVLRADFHERHFRGKERDFMHHYVDDAFSFLSFASAEPGAAVLRTPMNSLSFIFTGIGENGFLTFSRLKPSEAEVIARTIRERHSDDGKYWRWKPVADAMGRRVIEVVDHIDASEALRAMADDGHERAFIKGVRSKSGTWTVNLRGVKTTEDAMQSLVRDGFDRLGSFNGGMIVQEHLPTLREQRFFVTGGRIVASVCSDRNLNGTDRLEGRILDERVAIIKKPEVSGGEFDRGQTGHEVDRSLAARFARAARKIVRGMREEGRFHYVLDMGLTERGVVAVETNSFFRSGPYCLDRNRVAAAHRRNMTDAQREQAQSNISHIRRERESDAQRVQALRNFPIVKRERRSDAQCSRVTET